MVSRNVSILSDYIGILLFDSLVFMVQFIMFSSFYMYLFDEKFELANLSKYTSHFLHMLLAQ